MASPRYWFYIETVCKYCFKYWFHLAMVDTDEQRGEEIFSTGSSCLTETNTVEGNSPLGDNLVVRWKAIWAVVIPKHFFCLLWMVNIKALRNAWKITLMILGGRKILPSGFFPLKGYAPPPTPNPLNRKSFCQKKLSGIEGYPPPPFTGKKR